MNPEEDTHTPEPEKCDCWNGIKAYYSSCCGTSVTFIEPEEGIESYEICNDCKEECNVEIDKCETCKGEGYVYPTDTQREDYYEQKMEERRL